MIESVHIENFRGFKLADAPGLGRFNVVVGDNRVGKTAFLEALYLVAGNTPENHLKLRFWRGLYEAGGGVRMSLADIASGALWRDLVYGFDQTLKAKIVVRGTQNRSLTIAFGEPSIPVEGAIVEAPVRFTWADDEKEHVSVPRLIGSGLTFPNLPPGIHGAMLSTGSVKGEDTAARFSSLDKRNKSGPVIEVFRMQFPEIENLSVQLDDSGSPLVYAAICGMEHKMPLPLVSAGINRLLSILVTIADFPGGAVFVDEIESGIFYERLPKMWEAVNRFSKNNRTQVVATVHSGEALDALLPVIEADRADFRLVRLTEGGKIEVIKGGSLAAAISEHVEVR